MTASQVTETIDRATLVAELRRQVADRQPQDDTKPWSVAFLNLADYLEAGWLTWARHTGGCALRHDHHGDCDPLTGDRPRPPRPPRPARSGESAVCCQTEGCGHPKAAHVEGGLCSACSAERRVENPCPRCERFT